MVFAIANNQSIDIQANDWIDVDPSYISADPQWGFSVKVEAIDEFDQIWCYFWIPSLSAYELSTISPSIILDNFRKVPYE